MSWDGEKTLTFTMEDALITTDSLALLAAAKGEKMTERVHTQQRLGVYKGTETTPDKAYAKIQKAATDGDVPKITLHADNALKNVADNGLVYVLAADEGGFNSEPFLFTVNDLTEGYIKLATEPKDWTANYTNYYEVDDPTNDTYKAIATAESAPVFEPGKYYRKNPNGKVSNTDSHKGTVLSLCPYDIENKGMDGYEAKNLDELINATAIYLDYYTTGHGFTRLTIEPDSFGSNFYIEAETLFRDDSGADYAAIFTIPNCRVQSNFTITMASSGDPSSFTFTIDAFPGYTRFDPSKKVLAAIDIMDAVHGLDTSINYRTKTNEDTK